MSTEDNTSKAVGYLQRCLQSLDSMTSDHFALALKDLSEIIHRKQVDDSIQYLYHVNYGVLKKKMMQGQGTW